MPAILLRAPPHLFGRCGISAVWICMLELECLCIKDVLFNFSDGFVTNNLLRHEANDGEIDLMCNDLVGMIIIRIDYLFEQNCSSLGYFASVQLLLCLQNHFPNDNSGHHERVKEIQDKIENSRCQLDKKSSALYNFYLETV